MNVRPNDLLRLDGSVAHNSGLQNEAQMIASPYKDHKFEPAPLGDCCKVCGLSEHAVIHPKNGHDERKYMTEAGDRLILGEQAQSTAKAQHQPFLWDPVEAPAHYCKHKHTTAAIVLDWQLDFYLGNVLKYIERHRDKNQALSIQDLKKAAKYLSMEIELVETGKLEKTISHG